MLNTIVMIFAGIVFVGFWAYLAWDSHKEVNDKKPR
jgi:hypothetical protein